MDKLRIRVYHTQWNNMQAWYFVCPDFVARIEDSEIPWFTAWKDLSWFKVPFVGY